MAPALSAAAVEPRKTCHQCHASYPRTPEHFATRPDRSRGGRYKYSAVCRQCAPNGEFRKPCQVPGRVVVPTPTVCFDDELSAMEAEHGPHRQWTASVHAAFSDRLRAAACVTSRRPADTAPVDPRIPPLDPGSPFYVPPATGGAR